MSFRVLLEGWEPGLKKVEMSHLLRRDADMALAEAEQVVDSLLDGKELTIHFKSLDDTQKYLLQADKLNVSERLI